MGNILKIGSAVISREEAAAALEKEMTLVLAATDGERVIVRHMSHVNDGLDVYFQTGEGYEKMRFIRKNPHVALSVGTYDMEGVAIELGHPLNESNKRFAEIFNAKHPESFKRYAALDDETVVRVTVTGVKQWRYVDGEPVIAEGKFYGEAHMAESRCGLLCSECTYRESHNCGGCIATDGHPFHGECPVAVCCQGKNHTHCGECACFPCALLVEYTNDPEHGDNPPGKRIEQCRAWVGK